MTSPSLADDESEIIRHFIEDRYKYEYLILTKEVWERVSTGGSALFIDFSEPKDFPHSLCRKELRLMPAPTESFRMIFDDFSFSRFLLTGYP